MENSYRVNNTQNRDRMRYVDQALDELRQDANVISHYDKQIAKGPKGKIEDVQYVLSPSLRFISEIKKADRHQMEITDQARQSVAQYGTRQTPQLPTRAQAGSRCDTLASIAASLRPGPQARALQGVLA